MWGVVVGAGGSEPGAAEHNTHFCNETWLFFTKDLTDCSTVVCELQAIYHSSVVLIVRVQHTSL